MFIQENIEKLKREWTDKYVVIAGQRPELRRFEGYTGQVKTVNMSGRALVQFDAWNNIGWYDIEPGYLKVVPKPDPATAGQKAETKAAAPVAKAAAKPAAKPAAATKPTPAAAPATKGGRMSVAEMLAAARANKPTAAGAESASKPVAKAAPAAQPAPAAAPAAKGERLSVAEMLAAARANKPAATDTESASKPVAKTAPAEAPVDEAPAAIEPVDEKPLVEAPAAAPAAEKLAGGTTLPQGERPNIAQMLAYCRERDTTG